MISLNIDVNQVRANLQQHSTRIKAALFIITDTVAKQMEEWAKENAPWTDRTSNARQGLKGKAYWQDATTLVCSLSHSIEYGIWLELANERKYAVLEDSIMQNKDVLLNKWKEILEG